MSTHPHRFTVLFVIFMTVVCLGLIVWVPLNAFLDYRLSEAAMDLETSRGRERRQDYEYQQVTEALPLARQELAEARPEADALQQEVTDLKARRKELRAEKKRLEELPEAVPPENTAPAQEADHE